jgi:hypothetical protein
MASFALELDKDVGPFELQVPPLPQSNAPNSL